MKNLTTNQNNSADIIAENTGEKQEKSEKIIQLAVEKIKKQAETASGYNVPIVAIYNYLVERCNDLTFAQAVVKEEKNLGNCFKYITDRAFLAATKQNLTAPPPTRDNPLCFGMDSDEIFRLSSEYFELDDDGLEKIKESETAIIDNARKSIDEARRTAEKKKTEEKAKADAEKKAARKRKADAAKMAEAQMSLFDN